MKTIYQIKVMRDDECIGGMLVATPEIARTIINIAKQERHPHNDLTLHAEELPLWDDDEEVMTEIVKTFIHIK